MTGSRFLASCAMLLIVTAAAVAQPGAPFPDVLNAHDLTGEPAGDVIKIVPDANVRRLPGLDLPEQVSSTSDEFLTQVIDVRNASAAQRVSILVPLISRYRQLAAYKSDRAANVNRMIRIIRQIDQVADDAPTIVPNRGWHSEPPTSDEHLTRVLPVSDMHVEWLEARLRPELRPSFRLAVYSPSGLLERDSSHQRLKDVIQHLDQSRGQTNWMRSFLTEAHVTVRFGHDPPGSGV